MVASEPDVRYARSNDGVSVAWFELGSGPPLVWLPPVPFSNVIGQWRIPFMRRSYERLARRLRVILYDGRGTGHSDRAVEDVSLASHERDLGAVLAAARVERCALLGYYHSVPLAISYAAHHPDRVTHLVLFGGSLRPQDSMSSPETQALLTLIERDWELFVDSAAHAWMGWTAGPDGRLVAESFRTATTPGIARATLEAMRDVDVSGLVDEVSAPALVLHRQGERQMPIEVSQRLAGSLPHGRMLHLEGSAAGLFFEDLEGDAQVLLEFLVGGDAGGREAEPGSRTRTGRPGDTLSPRELDVLRLIAQGESNAAIAERLGLSIHTIERHAANLYRKIDARGRADATAYALRRGLA